MPRPTIDTGQELHDIADQAWDAVVSANDPAAVLVRGDDLVRVSNGAAVPYDRHSLSYRVSQCAQFGHNTQRGWVTDMPPLRAMEAVLSWSPDRYRDVPRVDRIVDVPVLAPDLSFITRPGPHPSGVYYAPSFAVDFDPDEEVHASDLEWARELLLTELLGDFAWRTNPDEAHALGLLLLPFVRDAIPEPTPLHAILAPQIESGKSWLAEAALIPGCGKVNAVPGTATDEEWRKRITSMLAEGSAAVKLDNLTGTIDSAALAAALTNGVWEDRLLGRSSMVSYPVRNVWVATGNNLGFSSELARRTVPIFLEPTEAWRQSKRRRKHLLEWAYSNRAELVKAALTLVQHWVDGPVGAVDGGYMYRRTGEGPRHFDRDQLASFLRWSEVIGGILDAAEVDGFLEGRDTWRAEADDSAREDAEFLEAWAQAELEPLRAKEVLSMMQYGNPLHEAVPSSLVGRPDQQLPKLNSWLRQRRNARIGGYQLRTVEGRRLKWFVRPLDEDASEPGTEVEFK